MKIKNIIERKNIDNSPKLGKAYKKMHILIEALNKKEIPSELLESINTDIITLNSFYASDKELIKSLKKTYSKILKLVETELKFVPKNHFRNLGFGIGMAFGVAFGSVFLLDNIGIGIPLGMVIGLAIGSQLDKKAKDSGKQIDLEI